MADEVLLEVSAEDRRQTIIRLQEKAERDRRSQMLYVRDEALKEGKENEKRQIARNLLSKGVDPTLVAETTGLSVEEIALL